MSICTFCHQETRPNDELMCYCCQNPLPCLTHKDTHHAAEDYGGVRDLDRGEWDNEGCEARICADCAVDCEECDMWVCAKCAVNKEEVLCNSCRQLKYSLY
jgi:hypothetical protein